MLAPDGTRICAVVSHDHFGDGDVLRCDQATDEWGHHDGIHHDPVRNIWWWNYPVTVP